MIRVTLTANLQRYYPEKSFEIEARSLRELLKKMDERKPLFSTYIVEPNFTIRKHVNVFINGEVIRDKTQTEVPFAPGDQVHLMQALSGG